MRKIESRESWEMICVAEQTTHPHGWAEAGAQVSWLSNCPSRWQAGGGHRKYAKRQIWDEIFVDPHICSSWQFVCRLFILLPHFIFFAISKKDHVNFSRISWTWGLDIRRQTKIKLRLLTVLGIQKFEILLFVPIQSDLTNCVGSPTHDWLAYLRPSAVLKSFAVFVRNYLIKLRSQPNLN